MKLSKFFVFFLVLNLQLPLWSQSEFSSDPIGEATSSFSLESKSTSVLKGTKLKLVVENGVEATKSLPGTIFVSRVIDSAYQSDTNSLLIPKGSWVTGVVTDVKQPGRFSKSGKLSLQLDYLTTLTGDLYPLNAVISFEQGKVNNEGQLDPQTGFKDKALQPTRKLLSSDTGQIVSIATLGLPVVVTLLGGSAKAMISKGDSIGLINGETFQIELKDSDLMIKN
ncbi:MAG: hypothetical protein SFU25_06380 [Candidatus Caenarcaniphilales bacterium]|nr:hypothetical protein [Candidatus Caenarcaniphilales bacterium]